MLPKPFVLLFYLYMFQLKSGNPNDVLFTKLYLVQFLFHMNWLTDSRKNRMKHFFLAAVFICMSAGSEVAPGEDGLSGVVKYHSWNCRNNTVRPRVPDAWEMQWMCSWCGKCYCFLLPSQHHQPSGPRVCRSPHLCSKVLWPVPVWGNLCPAPHGPVCTTLPLLSWAGCLSRWYNDCWLYSVVDNDKE